MRDSKTAKWPFFRLRLLDRFLDLSSGMETIGTLDLGTSLLDITLSRSLHSLTLRIGDANTIWRAERAGGLALAAQVWRRISAAAHQVVAAYLELSNLDHHGQAATTIYVEAGALGVVRVELADESPDATARLLIAVVDHVTGKVTTVVTRDGTVSSVRMPTWPPIAAHPEDRHERLTTADEVRVSGRHLRLAWNAVGAEVPGRNRFHAELLRVGAVVAETAAEKEWLVVVADGCAVRQIGAAQWRIQSGLSIEIPGQDEKEGALAEALLTALARLI